ncbi:MAG: class I tRNA ligase family protein [Anaerolineales bacterium]|nr:class I tRNA ligase family protein [Anaerolineales bacterium]
MAVPAHDERDFAFAIKFGLPIIPVIENPNRVTKSFAIGGTMKSGFKAALDDAGIPYEKQNGDVLVTLSGDQAEQYIEIAKAHLKSGCWNEVVGTQWVFIFEDETIAWDSLAAEEQILAKCKALEPGVQDKHTIMEMLWGVDFYQDVLYHSEYGKMINSQGMSGTPGDVAIKKTIAFLEEKHAGEKAVNYRLRDWLISRQRYWGAPIPMVYCEECGVQPVPEDQLPVELPDDIEWRPTGESPLKFHPTWKNTTCPECGGPATRETDTMDTFMCSSWYHLRYLSPDYAEGPFDPAEYNYWMPVDVYTGGIEHATMHLIYTRFFHKALRDMGITEGPEPMIVLRNQGIVLGEDSEKMSKSRGNVVAPDDLVGQYGADTVRAYLMFFARWDLGGPWNSQGIGGSARWLRRAWTLFTEAADGEPTADEKTLRDLRRKVHQTVESVTRDFQDFEFNTIISALMELMNEMYKAWEAGAPGSPEWDEALDIYLRLMAPVTPHVAEELWERLGKPYSIHTQAWPEADKQAAKEDEITLVVQINGKLRDRIQVPAGLSDAEAEEIAKASETVQEFIGGKPIRKVIVIQGKLVNIVI